jgi:hypothetical protein
MNGKFFLGILLAFIAIFVWGAAFWMNPLPNRLFQETGADEEFQALMKENLPGDGLYMVPSSHLEKEEMDRLYARGPIAMIFYYSGGMSGMSVSAMISSAVHDLLSVLFLALLMYMVRGSLATYGSRVFFAGLAGFGMAFFSNLTNAIWFFCPWGFALTGLLYDVTIWIVAALVLGAFIKPDGGRKQPA